MADEEKKDTGARSFAVLVAQLDEGRINAEASDALHALAVALKNEANNIGKASGKLTLTIDLKAEDNGTVTINAAVKSTAPKPHHARTIYWFGDGDNLVRENPRQTKLPLRGVEGGARARVVEGETQQAPRGV